MKLLSTPAAFQSEFKRLMRRYNHFDWAVAWATVNFDAFTLLKKHRDKIRHVVIGTEFHQTHPDFIAEFTGDAGVRFRMDQEGLNGVFHPKVYLFSDDESSWEAIIGSANFTRAAFTRNVECAVLVNIRSWFNLFVEQFQQADLAGDVRFRPPEFILCRPGASILSLAQRCSALLVDEAHDIPPFAARDLAELHNKDGLYLVVACDRHQKLRLAGSDAKIIEGLDFSNKSTRLSQIYRNPAPVYIASLGLMFRWFAEAGPKVIPSKQQLEDAFGFEVQVLPSGYEILMRSDAHPANSWCHTVASFPDAAAAYTALIKEKLGHRDVLWVRFSEEDPDFDYEQLIKHFTYHNCRDRDAHKISDKYIKGQDYPIVVIEGFPGFMDRYVASANETAESAEARAWAFRRELYLCASRATAFLYFICNVPESPEVLRIQGELQRLIEATATPERLNFGGTKSWRFLLTRTEQVRKVDVFADTITLPASNPDPQQPLQILESVPPPSAPPPSSEPLATKPTGDPSPSAIEPVSPVVPIGQPEPSISAAAAAPEPINGVPAEVVTESTKPDSPTALNQPPGPSTEASSQLVAPSPAPVAPVLGETATLADVARHLGHRHTQTRRYRPSLACRDSGRKL